MRFSESSSGLRELKVSSLVSCLCEETLQFSFLFSLFVRAGARFDSSRDALSIVEMVEHLEFLGGT
jgi:hypothetical protein